MTLLEKRNLGKDNAYMNIHEAPYHQTDSKERRAWIYQKKPCFDETVQQFWRMYCTPSSTKEDCSLPLEAEQDERRRFIRYPITTATVDSKLDSVVFGGIWIDNVKPKDKKGKKNIAQIHIKLSKDYRHLAYPFFEEFLKSVKRTYDHLYIGWGLRSIEDDPTNFLQNWGFKIKKNRISSQGILNLEDIK